MAKVIEIKKIDDAVAREHGFDSVAQLQEELEMVGVETLYWDTGDELTARLCAAEAVEYHPVLAIVGMPRGRYIVSTPTVKACRMPNGKLVVEAEEYERKTS